MGIIKINVNKKEHSVDVPEDKPLLWVLREELQLTGTKYGCGIAQCGACTVHVNGAPARSCVIPVSTVVSKRITTIEGIASDERQPIFKAWKEINVPQCGFCQTGQIMTAVALIDANSSPTDQDIDVAMKGNICRCGTYTRIRRAIKKAAEESS